MKQIVLAGGCFWGVESFLNVSEELFKLKLGIQMEIQLIQVIGQFVQERLHHVEARIFYDENIISLEKILEHLFRIIDPTSLNKQGGDIELISYRCLL